MIEAPRVGVHDLEDRTFCFARRVRAFVKRLPRTLCNNSDARELVHASGAAGANCIEANESPSRNDFRYRIRVTRTEFKKTRYWLRLLDIEDEPAVNAERLALIQEATEFMLTFGTILRNLG